MHQEPNRRAFNAGRALAVHLQAAVTLTGFVFFENYVRHGFSVSLGRCLSPQAFAAATLVGIIRQDRGEGEQDRTGTLFGAFGAT